MDEHLFYTKEESDDRMFIVINKSVGDELIISDKVCEVFNEFYHDLICNLLNQKIEEVESEFSTEEVDD